MKISIITVSYNRVNTIESSIKSVINQDYKNIEYIVVDGGSTDGTLAIIEKYRSRISAFVSEKDEGMYFALNKGIKMATGDVVGILHSDDFYSNDKIISRIVNEFKEKQTDAVYGDLQYVMENNINVIKRYWHSCAYQRNLFLKGWMPPHPSFFVKRDMYNRFGSFNTSFSFAADYELMLRLLYKNNLTASYIPEVLVKMRAGGISNSSLTNRIKANREDRLAWKVNGIRPTVLTLFLKPLSKLRQFFKT